MNGSVSALVVVRVVVAMLVATHPAHVVAVSRVVTLPRVAAEVAPTPRRHRRAPHRGPPLRPPIAWPAAVRAAAECAANDCAVALVAVRRDCAAGAATDRATHHRAGAAAQCVADGCAGDTASAPPSALSQLSAAAGNEITAAAVTMNAEAIFFNMRMLFLVLNLKSGFLRCCRFVSTSHFNERPAKDSTPIQTRFAIVVTDCVRPEGPSASLLFIPNPLFLHQTAQRRPSTPGSRGTPAISRTSISRSYRAFEQHSSARPRVRSSLDSAQIARRKQMRDRTVALRFTASPQFQPFWRGMCASIRVLSPSSHTRN